ncbi:MAG: hypothetical protein NZM00_03310, partial [Anaerolinea sp.]|nr:hypothetical protein [Anaerolinea sp.]
MSRRVVITGMGMITPLGHTVESTWEAIVAGRSGIARITRFDTSDSPVKIAAEIKDWDPTRYMNPKEARRRDRYQQLIFAAGMQAFEHSGLSITDENRARTGVIIGSAIGGVSSYYEELWTLFETRDLRRISPFAIPMMMVNGGGDYVAMEIGATGPSYVPASA